jgi:FAD:protein FMN transferase
VTVVFETMGTVVSLEADSAVDRAAVEGVFAEYSRRFSLYDPHSELSRLNAGALTLMRASDELRAVYAEALEWRQRTNGAFSPHRTDGAIDLNGVVKALAIDRASTILCGRWMLNVGGDVLSSGGHTVGIVDPDDRERLLASIVLTGARRAVATSGSAERGDHIWGAAAPNGTALDGFVQVTVVADDIVTADVCATAIVAGGVETLDDLTERFGIDVLTVGRDGSMLATPGIRSALAT